mgnify:FL=1
MAIRTIIIWLLFAATAFANQKDINFIQKINPKVEYNEALTISNLTREYSSKYQLDPNLVLAIMGTESTFKKKAKSYRKSIGYMQVHHSSWKDDKRYKMIVPNRNSLLIPRVNIEAGCYILSELRKEDRNRYVSMYLGERNYQYIQKVKKNRELHRKGK